MRAYNCEWRDVHTSTETENDAINGDAQLNFSHTKRRKKKFFVLPAKNGQN